jgi:hypothetical protein
VLKNTVDWSGRRRRLLREYGAGETPQALSSPRRLHGMPAESEAAWSENQQPNFETHPKFKVLFQYPRFFLGRFFIFSGLEFSLFVHNGKVNFKVREDYNENLV